MVNCFIAHFRQYDGAIQTVSEHLQGVADQCAELADKIHCQDMGQLLGLLHDVGKYGGDFQKYIRSATGKSNPDADDEFAMSTDMRGRIDHPTAGAQWLRQQFQFNDTGEPGTLLGQLLAVWLLITAA